MPKLELRVQTDPETDRRLDRLWLGPIVDRDGYDKLQGCVRDYAKAARLALADDPWLIERLLFATGGLRGRSIEYTLLAIRRALFSRRATLELDD